MDVARPPRSTTPRNGAIAGGIVALLGATTALARLKPTALTVEASSLVTDTVRRG